MLPMTPLDKEIGEQPVRNVQTSSYWRAVCCESSKHGSEGDCCKSVSNDNSVAVYPTWS